MLHIYKLNVGVLADTLHQFVNDGICKFVIHCNKCLVGNDKTYRATSLPRSKMGRKHNRTAVANLLLNLLGIVYLHTVHQSFITHARLTYGVDNLLGKIFICTSAYLLQLLFALIGERTAEVVHYDLASVVENIAEE